MVGSPVSRHPYDQALHVPEGSKHSGGYCGAEELGNGEPLRDRASGERGLEKRASQRRVQRTRARQLGPPSASLPVTHKTKIITASIVGHDPGYPEQDYPDGCPETGGQNLLSVCWSTSLNGLPLRSRVVRQQNSAIQTNRHALIAKERDIGDVAERYLIHLLPLAIRVLTEHFAADPSRPQLLAGRILRDSISR